MTVDELKASLKGSEPPGLAAPLRALWLEARGDWEAAHRVAQEIEDATGAWVHAYLHRREGDTENAAYWYRRAGRPVASVPMDREWEQIAAELLAQ